MPIPYYKIPIEQLVLHKKVYNLINIRGNELWSNWNMHEFEGAIIQNSPYHSMRDLNKIKDYLKAELEL